MPGINALLMLLALIIVGGLLDLEAALAKWEWDEYM